MKARKPSNGNKTSVISEKGILFCKATAKEGHRQQKCYRAEHRAHSRHLTPIFIPRFTPNMLDAVKGASPAL